MSSPKRNSPYSQCSAPSGNSQKLHLLLVYVLEVFIIGQSTGMNNLEVLSEYYS